ncbi:putative sugar transporter [Teratosphaeria destructans]|uniref:Sugar transporter n=1 Tax=Teratosphaeria destructans TaxID=418781 RepID=A0A9W7SU06_9PEZI|nr:putative sugar transporter [Teratosphaeria destructans]
MLPQTEDPPNEAASDHHSDPGAPKPTPMEFEDSVLDPTATDPILAAKMALLNTAIDEIGMTPWQWTLFLLNGFGYAVDSLLIVCQSIAQPAVAQEFPQPSTRIQGVALASQIGLLHVRLRHIRVDRGRMPGYVSFCAMVAVYSAGAGGNYILDATSLIEFLPATHVWLVTFMAVWWAVGSTVTGLLAWGFMANFSCEPDALQCFSRDNMGWRLLHFTAGGLVLLLSILRLAVIKMPHTPKWLVSQNRDQEAFNILDLLSRRYHRKLSLSLEELQSQGRVLNTELSVWSTQRLRQHFSGLFRSKLLAYSTTMIIANWFVVGAVTPLYTSFLPFYLASRGAATGDDSSSTTWRNYAINQISGLFGPVIAGILVETRFFGRKGTLAFGALITMILQFGYTQIKTPTQNLAVSSAITAASNIYYGTIYAYTPEVLPSAHRATGYGICVVMNRVGGIVGVLIGSYANVETVVPLFVCAGLFGALIVLSLMLPFESRGKRSV